jgi:hypothetical protein
LDLSAAAILKKLDAFRKTEWFTAVLLVVLGFVAVGTFQFTAIGGLGICLGIVLPPVTVFVIPYWLGERRIKRFALFIVPVIIIAIVVISALQTQAVLAQTPPNLSSGTAPNTPASDLPAVSLWNGTVEPHDRASANSTYAFHVRLKGGPSADLSQVKVYVNISELEAFGGTPLPFILMAPDASRNSTNGSWYVAWQALGPNAYGFYFYVNDGRGNLTFTEPVLAPVLAPWSSYYFLWFVFIGENYGLYTVSFYFVILFMYWYTIRTRKMRQRLIERSGEKKGDLKKGAAETEESGKEAAAPAPTREKTKKAAAFTCTNCGADVTEEDTKCPKCGAVFED